MPIVDIRSLPPEDLSLAERIALLPDDEKEAFHASLSDEEAAHLIYDWDFWARPDQQEPPEGWLLWIISEGRGAGKTRTGSEWVRRKVQQPGGKGVGVLVGDDPTDIRDFMIEGPSGLLEISPAYERPHYEPSKMRLTWPNGHIAHIRSAEDPESIRGASAEWAWCDELGKWRYAQSAWDNLRFALREGIDPQTLITTTPRNIPLLKKLMGDPRKGIGPAMRGTHISPPVSTYRNAANLAPSFLQEMEDMYEGTRLGQQELHAIVVEEAEGALWSRQMIEADRVDGNVYRAVVAQYLRRTGVAVDPAVTSKATSDETGIVAGGMVTHICPLCQNTDGRDHYFIVLDRSILTSPQGWAARAVETFRTMDADTIVAEANNGGELVSVNLAAIDNTVPVRLVHASKGKVARAEPVVLLYEQHRVHHVGELIGLEDEMVTWEPDVTTESPNRIDALAWLVWDLAFRNAPKKATSNASQLARARLG